jgi:hypothetical protein
MTVAVLMMKHHLHQGKQDDNAAVVCFGCVANKPDVQTIEEQIRPPQRKATFTPTP